ncbi:MAG: putative sulfate exporter family transporter, partial [Pseudomonadales bacterium]|nr:putative sulfate exporter family transporter [Pseudomonadales bacterium]
WRDGGIAAVTAPLVNGQVNITRSETRVSDCSPLFSSRCGWAPRLGVEPQLTRLIIGTSVCGASAVIAANTVAHGSDEDVIYAVATVSIFGSLSVLLYPIAGHLLQMTADTHGLWAGTSIHEIGQVVAATDAWPASSDAAMIASCRASCCSCRPCCCWQPSPAWGWISTCGKCEPEAGVRSCLERSPRSSSAASA